MSLSRGRPERCSRRWYCSPASAAHEAGPARGRIEATIFGKASAVTSSAAVKATHDGNGVSLGTRADASGFLPDLRPPETVLLMQPAGERTPERAGGGRSGRRAVPGRRRLTWSRLRRRFSGADLPGWRHRARLVVSGVLWVSLRSAPATRFLAVEQLSGRLRVNCQAKRKVSRRRRTSRADCMGACFAGALARWPTLDAASTGDSSRTGGRDGGEFGR
jgi:hypothetical protein